MTTATDTVATPTTTALVHISSLVTNDPSLGEGPLGLIQDAAVVIDGDRIAWVGETSKAPATDNRVDAAGRAAIPGFVDSHSHLVFAGDRTEEFNARMSGRAYSAGGIRTTVAATRAASNNVLNANVARYVVEALHQGTTTLEIKSGYGLTSEDEARALSIAAAHTDEVTFLGAHIVAPEF
ncbi:imidazolonepropionase, partial [Streptomyces himastatinicus ATCC 53653]